MEKRVKADVKEYVRCKMNGEPLNESALLWVQQDMADRGEDFHAFARVPAQELGALAAVDEVILDVA